MHTSLKSKGGGTLHFCMGGQRFMNKIVKVGPLIWVLLHFYSQVFFICRGGVLCYTPFPPPSTTRVHLCASEQGQEN